MEEQRTLYSNQRYENEYKKHQVQKSLTIGKLAVLIGIPATAYFIFQDLFIINEPNIFYLRLIFIVPLVIFSIGIFTFLRNKKNLIPAFYNILLLSLYTMSLAFNYYALTQKAYDPNFIHAIITSLIVNTFIIFILSFSIRKYVKYILLIPFILFFLLLVIFEPLIAIKYFSYYSNPAIIIAIVIFLTESIDKLEFNEFNLRMISEERKTKLEEQVNKQKVLNENLEKALKENAALNEVLMYQALYDHLTGVHNKGPGLQMLEKDIHYYKRNDRALTICYIDIDNLKFVNDNFGHTEGDKLIKVIITSLSNHIRSCDYIIRMGGDEFLIVFLDCSIKDANNIIIRAKKALNEVNKNIPIYSCNFSYGFSEYSGKKDKQLNQLINAADEAMYFNKTNKKT